MNNTIKILGIVLGLVVLSAAILVAAPVKKAKAADDSMLSVTTQNTDGVNAQGWYGHHGRGFHRGHGWYGRSYNRGWYGYPYYRGGWYGYPYGGACGTGCW